MSNKERFVSIESMGDSQLKVELSYPMESVYSVFSSPCMGVMNKAYVEVNGEDAYMNPVGTEAYKLKEWTKGSKIELEAFEDYNGGAPFIKNICLLRMIFLLLNIYPMIFYRLFEKIRG